jgi:two-component sensor histidine kinase
LVDTDLFLRARQRFSDLDHVPIGLAVLDRNLGVVFWNGTLEQWSGIDRNEAVGRPLADLNPEWAQPHYAERLSHLFEGGPPVLFSSLLHPRLVPQKQATGQSFHVKAAALPDGEGGWWAFLSVEDVTVLSRRVDDLRVLRTQQDRLMREIHHRVKNNLNLISGLVTMQKSKLDGPANGALEDLQSRIAAIAEIHDILYQSSSLSFASTANYLETLAQLLDRNLSLSDSHRLVLDLDPLVTLRTDVTVLLGLIQAELMTNALKYGLGREPDEVLTIRLARLGPQEYEYSLTHTGDRLPESFDPKTSSGLGMVLLTAYADQMGSALCWSRGDPTRFWLRFRP